MNRRNFIKLLSAFPFLLTPKAFSIESNLEKKYLVLIELKGGNDGLNTVVPYTDDDYYESRPTISISSDNVIEINSELGFNPELTVLDDIFTDNDLAIIQNVGYSNPNKSHFKSLDIWEKASHDKNANGWLYELFKRNRSENLVDALVFSGSTGFFEGPNPNFLKVNNISKFVKRGNQLNIPTNSSSDPIHMHLLNSKKLIKKVSSSLEDSVDFYGMDGIRGRVSLSDQLFQVSRLIESNVNVPVFKVSIKDLDTHSEQHYTHQEILSDLNSSLDEFIGDLKNNNLWDNTLILTYSEFGRRIRENGSKGTDHGEASCMFCMGGKVKGGVYGSNPDLKNNHDGNLISKIDFKEVYATLEKKWFRSKSGVVKNPPLEFL